MTRPIAVDRGRHVDGVRVGRQRRPDLHTRHGRGRGGRSGRRRWDVAAGLRAGDAGKRERDDRRGEREVAPLHPATIFWMIVIAAGANSANAKPRPALAIAPFAFSSLTGSPPAMT